MDIVATTPKRPQGSPRASATAARATGLSERVVEGEVLGAQGGDAVRGRIPPQPGTKVGPLQGLAAYLDVSAPPRCGSGQIDCFA